MKELTIVIPHKNRHDLLKEQIKFLDENDYNYIVVRGGTFAENCNTGFRAVSTPYVCFLNDDVILKEGLFESLIEEAQRIDGATSPTLINPDGTIQQTGITFALADGKAKFFQSKDLYCPFPNGACLCMPSLVFKGFLFDEEFLNGYEDTDLFLSMYREKVPMTVIPFQVVHLARQSEGRISPSNEQHNVEYLFKKKKEYIWGGLVD